MVDSNWILFTAPWDPIFVRRGDALGLTALADQFADRLAPHLSNRIRDGRWVTILAWCLARSQEVFHACGGRSLITSTEQRNRYAWLRPLELMWTARTIALAEDWRNRSLTGQRSVRPWYEDYNQGTDKFGLSSDQFWAYRQTGMYGAYRLAFRRWPQMTTGGDGWTPGPATNSLARWLDDRLGVARPPWPLYVGDHDYERLPKRGVKLAKGSEDKWWMRQWKTFDHGGKKADENTLPRRRDDFSALPERDLLKPLIFGSGKDGTRRFDVARRVSESKARGHIELCEHLAENFSQNSVIKILPTFSRLADAGMSAMDLVAKALQNESRVALSDIAAEPSAKSVCKELTDAARLWRKNEGVHLPHIERANRFAAAMVRSEAVECLGALLQYHELHGGGLRWFVLRKGWVAPRTPPRVGSSRYRFRLWSLCRLAAQCGVLRSMPPALRHDIEEEEDENS